MVVTAVGRKQTVSTSQTSSRRRTVDEESRPGNSLVQQQPRGGGSFLNSAKLALEYYGLTKKDRQCLFTVSNNYRPQSTIKVTTKWAYHGKYQEEAADPASKQFIRHGQKNSFNFNRSQQWTPGGCSGILAFEVLNNAGNEFVATVAIAFNVPLIHLKTRNKFSIGVFDKQMEPLNTVDDYQVMFSKTSKRLGKTDAKYHA